MRRAGTLVAVPEFNDRVLVLELTHRPWWRRIPFAHRPRVETIHVVGLTPRERTVT
jgi:hypothetical protein